MSQGQLTIALHNFGTSRATLPKGDNDTFYNNKKGTNGNYFCTARVCEKARV